MLEMLLKNPANFITLLVMLVIIVSVIVYTYNRKKGLLAKAALYIVAKAEEEFNSNTGKIKFAKAYTYLRKEYPILTFLISEEKLTDIIEEALVEFKKILTSKASKEKEE